MTVTLIKDIDEFNSIMLPILEQDLTSVFWNILEGHTGFTNDTLRQWSNLSAKDVIERNSPLGILSQLEYPQIITSPEDSQKVSLLIQSFPSVWSLGTKDNRMKELFDFILSDGTIQVQAIPQGAFAVETLQEAETLGIRLPTAIQQEVEQVHNNEPTATKVIVIEILSGVSDKGTVVKIV